MLLEVRSGELGLRQSDALFQHVKRLPEIVEQLLSGKNLTIHAVGASVRPRNIEGSYMPCFLAGLSQARVLAQSLGVPFFGFSHQEGHFASVLYSADRLDLMNQEFLAWHLSGGTTELLHVMPGLRVEIIGGSEDLSAGQLIDRTGQLLQLDFPAGRSLDELAGETVSAPFPIKLRGLNFSLSGMQNKIADVFHSGASREETAAFALSCICDVVKRTTKAALLQYGELPVIFTGGVSSNTQLRRTMRSLNGIFGEPRFSTDNAMGIAVLAEYHFREQGGGAWRNS